MPDGQTLLYLASKEGNFYIMKYMLDKKLNPKIKSKVSSLLNLKRSEILKKAVFKWLQDGIILK